MAIDGTKEYSIPDNIPKAMGVGGSKVKRSVVYGVLPAHKTGGGYRKLATVDVLEWVPHGVLQDAELTRLSDSPTTRRQHHASNLKSDELFNALVDYNDDVVRRYIIGAFRRSSPIENIADHPRHNRWQRPDLPSGICTFASTETSKASKRWAAFAMFFCKVFFLTNQDVLHGIWQQGRRRIRCSVPDDRVGHSDLASQNAKIRRDLSSADERYQC